MGDGSHEQNEIRGNSGIVEQIKAEVLEAIMVEVRPLLQQLADLAASQKAPSDQPQLAAQGMQLQAAARLADLQNRITERINTRRNNIQKYIRKK
ncbi:MAG: hypothetical protein PW843_19740 [Azospirillaceae bacterium]|nr:hypothetical protein [Azospirillaceae bacterium]